MNQDNPFAESYRNESVQYKQEQIYLQQLKEESEKLDLDINSLRTQIECLKHTAEAVKNETSDLNRDNDRITSLVNLKRNDFKLKYSSNPLVPLINQALVTSSSSASKSSTPTAATAQANSIFNSNTPKGNKYLFFKFVVFCLQTNYDSTANVQCSLSHKGFISK